MFCLHMCKCAMGAPGACRGQKGVLDPLELKFGWLWATMWLGESNLGPLQEPYFRHPKLVFNLTSHSSEISLIRLFNFRTLFCDFSWELCFCLPG